MKKFRKLLSKIVSTIGIILIIWALEAPLLLFFLHSEKELILITLVFLALIGIFMSHTISKQNNDDTLNY
jgi:predicted membrane channel-forming protein YqfA (hemolysin III family)